MCGDIRLPPLDYPCAGLDPLDRDSLALDPFVIAPQEIQGCLVLDDQGLPDVVENLVFDHTPTCAIDGLTGFYEMSRVEAVGIEYDEQDTDPDGPCDPTSTGDGCVDATTVFEPYKLNDNPENPAKGVARKAEIWSRLVEVYGQNATPQCPEATGDRRAFRYRIVPGTTGNLGNPYLTNRFRLNFEGNDASCGDDTIHGAIRLNPAVGTNLGNGAPMQMLPQTLPGVRESVTQSLEACFGKIQAFVGANTPLSPLPGNEPRMIGEGSDPGCSDPKVIFPGAFPNGDVYFQGKVLSDPTTGLVVMPLPEGTYSFQPSVVFAGQSGRTTFPTEGPFNVICGETTRLCTSNLVPGPTNDSVPTVSPPQPIVLDASCLNEVEITFDLFDCDQGDEATLYVTITSDDVVEPDDRGFTQPLARKDVTGGAWDGTSPITLPQNCGPYPYPFVLDIGDGPSSSSPRGTTTYTFTFRDPDGNEIVRTVEVRATDDIPPSLDCTSHAQCMSAPDVFLDDICAQNILDNCDLDPDLTWTTTGATDPPLSCPPDCPVSDCAEGVYDAGLTTVEFQVADDFGGVGTCDAAEEGEALLPCEPEAIADVQSPVCEVAPFPEDPANPAPTMVELDGSRSLEDSAACDPERDGDGLGDGPPPELDFSWSVDNGVGDCPADVSITDPAAAVTDLVVPDQVADPALCEPIVDCNVTLQVSESHATSSNTIDCSDITSSIPVTIDPAPVADPVPGTETEYEFCEAPADPGGYSGYPLDGSDSFSCMPGGLAYSWEILPGCPASASLVDENTATPTFRIANADLPVVCTVKLIVTDDLGCVREARTDVHVDTNPAASQDPPEPTCMDDSGSTTDIQLSGSGDDRDPAACALQYIWTHVGCPPGTEIVDTGDPTRPILRLPNDSNPVSCQACLQVAKPDCGGCLSEVVCEDVQSCPNPDAAFESQFSLELSGSNGCGGNPPPPLVEFVEDATVTGGCGFLALERWDFPPDGDPLDPSSDPTGLCLSDDMQDLCAPDPDEGDIGDDPIVAFVAAGIKMPSLEVGEQIGLDAGGAAILCNDLERPCGLCLPECVSIANTGDDGAVTRFKVDCTPASNPQPCDTSDLAIQFQFFGFQDCCPPPYTLAPGATAILWFDACGDPDQTNEEPSSSAEMVAATSIDITGWPDDKLLIDATFPSGCLINKLLELGCDCDQAIPEFWIRLDVSVQGSACSCDFPLVIDEKVLPSGNLDPFKLFCNDSDCLDPLNPPNCACP